MRNIALLTMMACAVPAFAADDLTTATAVCGTTDARYPIQTQAMRLAGEAPRSGFKPGFEWCEDALRMKDERDRAAQIANHNSALEAQRKAGEELVKRLKETSP